MSLSLLLNGLLPYFPLLNGLLLSDLLMNDLLLNGSVAGWSAFELSLMFGFILNGLC
jgi:hypothetical protein